jgi:hypothetical protein
MRGAELLMRRVFRQERLGAICSTCDKPSEWNPPVSDSPVYLDLAGTSDVDRTSGHRPSTRPRDTTSLRRFCGRTTKRCGATRSSASADSSPALLILIRYLPALMPEISNSPLLSVLTVAIRRSGAFQVSSSTFASGTVHSRSWCLNSTVPRTFAVTTLLMMHVVNALSRMSPANARMRKRAMNRT